MDLVLVPAGCPGAAAASALTSAGRSIALRALALWPASRPERGGEELRARLHLVDSAYRAAAAAGVSPRARLSDAVAVDDAFWRGFYVGEAPRAVPWGRDVQRQIALHPSAHADVALLAALADATPVVTGVPLALTLVEAVRAMTDAASAQATLQRVTRVIRRSPADTSPAAAALRGLVSITDPEALAPLAADAEPALAPLFERVVHQRSALSAAVREAPPSAKQELEEQRREALTLLQAMNEPLPLRTRLDGYLARESIWESLATVARPYRDRVDAHSRAVADARRAARSGAPVPRPAFDEGSTKAIVWIAPMLIAAAELLDPDARDRLVEDPAVKAAGAARLAWDSERRAELSSSLFAAALGIVDRRTARHLVAVRFANPAVAPPEGTFVGADAARSIALWAALDAGGVGDVTLLPTDVYGNGGPATLPCSAMAPVLRAVALGVEYPTGTNPIPFEVMASIPEVVSAPMPFFTRRGITIFDTPFADGDLPVRFTEVGEMFRDTRSLSTPQYLRGSGQSLFATHRIGLRWLRDAIREQSQVPSALVFAARVETVHFPCAQ